MKRFFIPLAALFSLVAPALTRAAPPIYPGVVPYEQLDTRNFYLGNYPILRIMPFMPKDTPPYLPVDTWSFAVNTNLWTLYAYDPPNTTWHQVLGLGGIAVTINPTDTVMPYRVDATTFGDSPWSVPGAGQAYADGANAFLHLDLATGNSAYHTTTPNSTLAIYPQMLMEQVPAMGDTVSTTTMAEGMLVSNPTPSTAAAPENSPSMYWGGSAWSTNGAASTPMAFAAVGVPRNAANIPTAYWSLFSSVSNRPPTLEFTVKEGSGYTGLGTSYLSDAGTYTSNLTTWSTYLMYSTVTNLNVWNLTITNGGTINYGGTNIPTINPTISYIPYNLNGTNFADSVMYQSLGAINIADPGLDSELWVRDTAPTSTAKANLGSAETNAWLQLDAGGANATVLLSPNAGSGVPSPFKPFYLHTTYTVSPGVNLFEIFNNGTTNFAVDASSGYTGTGSKVLTDNGTYQTASSVITGAISSQLLWTNSPTGGGSLTASSNVIASLPTGLYGSVFNNSEDIFAAGENAGQGQAVLQSTNLYNIGLLSGYGMTGNEAWFVMNIGDAAGRGATVYNSQDVYNFGIAPGELAQITNGSWVVMNIGDNAGYAMVTDKSQDIFNYGWLSGDSMGVSNSIAIFNYGDWAGRNNISVIQNSQEIYNYGYAAGVDQNPRNSTNLYNYGNIAGGVQQAIEVNGYYNYGTDSGWMGVGLASNSEELYNYGAWAGASLAALVADGTFVNFTNVYNYGPEAGMQIKGTNATYVLNYGYRAGEQSTMTGVSDLYNYGSDSGFQSTYDTSATDIYNYGTSAGKGASYTNAFFILNSGNSAGQSMIAQDSSGILNLGSYSGANMVATNSSSIVNIGLYAGNLANLTNSTYVFSYGDRSGNLMVAKNSSADIFNYGHDAGQSMIADGSTDIYNFGFDSGGTATAHTNSALLFSYGDTAGNSVTTNSFDVFAYGDRPLAIASVADSVDIFAYGHHSLTESVLTNSYDIFAYGYQALYQAQLTNSSQIYAYGNQAGASLAGDGYSDIYLFGTAQPTRKTNEFTFGGANDRYDFPGLDGIHAIRVYDTNNVVSFGADPTGVADSTAAIQAAFNSSYVNGGPIYIPYGTYTVTSTLSFAPTTTKARLICDGTISSSADPALQVGTYSAQTGYSYIENLKVTRTGGISATGIGVVFVNLSECRIDCSLISGFGTNVVVVGDGRGCVYNDFRFGLVYNGMANMFLTATNAGWCNENRFYGGNFTWQSGLGSYVGRVGVYIDNCPNALNNLRFFAPTFEASNTNAIAMVINGTDNEVLYARVEGTGPIEITANATGTVIDFGNGITGAQQNFYDLGLQTTLRTRGYQKSSASVDMGANLRLLSDYDTVLLQAKNDTNYYFAIQNNYTATNNFTVWSKGFPIWWHEAGPVYGYAYKHLPPYNGAQIFHNTGTNASLVVETSTTDTAPFIIQAGGNVGIGLVNPTTKLDVVGDIKASGVSKIRQFQDGYTNVLTSATGKDFFYVSVPNTNGIGGHVVYTVFCTDGTDVQEISGDVKFAAVAKSTTVTASTADVQGPAVVTGGSTLTAALAANVATNNVFALGVTATTSLTTTNLVIKWRVETPSTFTVNAIP